MLSDSSVRVNDFIEIEGGPTGWVEDIGWRATRLRTFDNNLIMIPNSHLADKYKTGESHKKLKTKEVIRKHQRKKPIVG